VRQTTVLMGKKKKNKGKQKQVRKSVAKQTPLQTIDEEENLKMLADIATMTNEFQVEPKNTEITTDITAMIAQALELAGEEIPDNWEIAADQLIEQEVQQPIV